MATSTTGAEDVVTDAPAQSEGATAVAPGDTGETYTYIDLHG